ncbi:hypothetical protein Trydic_g20064 [Trypoxylus dichotomus]
MTVTPVWRENRKRTAAGVIGERLTRKGGDRGEREGRKGEEWDRSNDGALSEGTTRSTLQPAVSCEYYPCRNLFSRRRSVVLPLAARRIVLNADDEACWVEVKSE